MHDLLHVKHASRHACSDDNDDDDGANQKKKKLKVIWYGMVARCPVFTVGILAFVRETC